MYLMFHVNSFVWGAVITTGPMQLRGWYWSHLPARMSFKSTDDFTHDKLLKCSKRLIHKLGSEEEKTLLSGCSM